MNVSDFIKNRRVYMDGAIGTELMKLGLDAAHGDEVNLTAPDAVRNIAASYFDAGSDTVFTNTFGCNLLKRKCSVEELENLIVTAITVTKSAAIGRVNKFVGYSAGPLPELMQPYGKLTFEEAYEQYAVQARAVMKCPPDFVAMETFTDLWLLKAAILAFKENTNLPVWCSMSFNDNGRSFSGASVETYALTAQGLGAEALGINCGFGPDKMLPLAKRLTAVAHVPVYIKPNAGLPRFVGGKTSYDIDADKFADYMREIAETGVSMLGGCCGTDPEYIRKTIEKTKNVPYELFDNRPVAVCSSSDTVELAPFVTVGERVNPTGKPRLKQALLDKDFDYVLGLCNAQLDKGAKILDINVGMSGVDEPTLLPETVVKVSSAVSCPLMIDTSNRTAMKNALRVVPGIPVINSVNGDDECLDAVLPLAKKYGAYLVAICLDGNGIPATAEGRIAIAKHILAKAAEYGIDKSRFLFDALTMAVSVNIENANITINTLKALNSLGLNTVLGLSNVSFGLPAREIVNGAFLYLTKKEGLTSAIVNPALKENEDATAIAMLTGRDKDCAGFIAKYSDYVAPKTVATNLTLADCIIGGLKNDGVKIARATATAENFADIINGDVIGALNEVGKRYEEGRAFLPQLIIAAEAAGAILDYLKTAFIPEGEEVGKVMLIATVKGDIHDIGKNIVKAVLSNYGYKIYDLGRDVSTETVLENIKLRKPQIVGLSALMTTSLDSMRETTRAIKNYDENIVVMIGGAVVTEEFRQEIGADIYSADAQEAVKKLADYFS